MEGSPMRLASMRLTDQLLPATDGMYDAIVVKSFLNVTWVSWWPVGPMSFHLSLGDGFAGWSGDLEQTPSGLQGAAAWSSDTAQKDGGWILHASRAACDP